MYPSVEASLKQVRIKYLDTGALLSGKVSQHMMQREWWTQVSQAATLKDVKERILDSVNSAGYQLTAQELRLWIDFQSEDPEQSLAARCAEVAKSKPTKEEPDQEMVNEGDGAGLGDPQVVIEPNSGVEFPG